MAFAISGRRSSPCCRPRRSDQRLVLGGYRPHELLLGRLLFLGLLGLLIGAGSPC
jgi:hypothetical protein